MQDNVMNEQDPTTDNVITSTKNNVLFLVANTYSSNSSSFKVSQSMLAVTRPNTKHPTNQAYMTRLTA